MFPFPPPLRGDAPSRNSASATRKRSEIEESDLQGGQPRALLEVPW